LQVKNSDSPETVYPDAKWKDSKTGQIFIFEIQRKYHKGFVERTGYYSAGTYYNKGGQIFRELSKKVSDRYKELRPMNFYATTCFK
jgi:hypothetical protein